VSKDLAAAIFAAVMVCGKIMAFRAAKECRAGSFDSACRLASLKDDSRFTRVFMQAINGTPH